MFFEDSYETPGWPRDMAIRVSTGSSLLELLWLRHHALGNAEPALPPADLPGEPSPSQDPALVGRWESLWKTALDHERRVQELDAQSIPQHPELWSPPSTRELTDALDLALDSGEGVRRWQESLTVDPDAERTVTDSTRHAWEAGLRVVLELPLRGSYHTKLTSATMLVSTATRRDPVAYAEALEGFRRG